MSGWVVPLPFDSPPMRENDRYPHWGAKARETKRIREAAAWATKAAKVPRLDRALITLHWIPRVDRARDENGPSPTLKAAIDGVVDAGVLVDDDVTHCIPRCQVHEPSPAKTWRGNHRLWLTIEELTDVIEEVTDDRAG